MTHTAHDPGFARRIFDRVRQSRQQQDNEQWHLLILQELIGARGIREGSIRYWLVPQLVAFVYYQIVWLLYVVRPAAAYRLNAEFEDHAEHEYMEFVRDHPELEQAPFDSVLDPGLRAVRLAGGPVPPDRVRRAGAQGGVAGLAGGAAVHAEERRRRRPLTRPVPGYARSRGRSPRGRAGGRRSAARPRAAPARPPSDRRSAWPPRAPVARPLGDEPVHGLADAPVRGVPLGRRPELQHVHRLAGVHLHVEADPVGHAHRIGRHGGEARGRDGVVERGRRLHDPPPVGAAARPPPRPRAWRTRGGGRAAATRATAGGAAGGRGRRRSP